MASLEEIKPLTWEKLAERIAKMSDEQKRTTVTVLDTALLEFFPVRATIKESEDDDVLHKGHPYLVVDNDPEDYK